MSGSAERPRCRSEVEIMTGRAAESLLAIFEDIQWMHQQDRQALIQELDALGPPQT
jgi:hypothetical protein